MTREKALQVCHGLESNWFMSDEIREAMALAIEALKQPERKKGKWFNDRGMYRCTACNEMWVKWWAAYMEPARMYKEMKYCPNCGAKMEENDGGKNDG